MLSATSSSVSFLRSNLDDCEPNSQPSCSKQPSYKKLGTPRHHTSAEVPRCVVPRKLQGTNLHRPHANACAQRRPALRARKSGRIRRNTRPHFAKNMPMDSSQKTAAQSGAAPHGGALTRFKQRFSIPSHGARIRARRPTNCASLGRCSRRTSPKAGSARRSRR